MVSEKQKSLFFYFMQQPDPLNKKKKTFSSHIKTEISKIFIFYGPT